MKGQVVLLNIISLILLLSPTILIAGEEVSHDLEGHAQHDAHEHGAARLMIAATGEQLEIILESPGVNLVGFEHAATSAADRQRLADAKAKLDAGQNLFRINPEAECTLKNSHVDIAALGHEDHDAHEEHKDHGEHAQHEEGETHSDIEATWLFTCAEPSDLATIQTGLFAAFPKGFEKIMVEWLTDKNASAITLEQDAVIELKR